MPQPMRNAKVILEVEGDVAKEYDNFILVTVNDEGILQCASIRGMNAMKVVELATATVALAIEVTDSIGQQESNDNLQDRISEN